jgi:hypothetical protein
MDLKKQSQPFDVLRRRAKPAKRSVTAFLLSDTNLYQLRWSRNW